MTTFLEQGPSRQTYSGSSSSLSMPYTADTDNSVICLGMFWSPSSASISSITSTGITWTSGFAKIVDSSFGVAYQAFYGVVSSVITPDAAVISFSAAVTSWEGNTAEFSTNLTSPSWALVAGAGSHNDTNVSTFTAAPLSLAVNDLYWCQFVDSAVGVYTPSSPLTGFTYLEPGNRPMAYGLNVPTATSYAPAFSTTVAAEYFSWALALRPSGGAPPLWVPPTTGMGFM